MKVVLAIGLMFSQPVVDFNQVARTVIAVLGDATRTPYGQAAAPPSTQLEVVPDPPPICHPEDSRTAAVSAAIRFFMAKADWAWACAVAWCESRFVPTTRNGDHVGLFQISTRIWSGVAASLRADLWSISGNTAVAREVLNQQGRRAWQCTAMI